MLPYQVPAHPTSSRGHRSEEAETHHRRAQRQILRIQLRRPRPRQVVDSPTSPSHIGEKGTRIAKQRPGLHANRSFAKYANSQLTPALSGVVQSDHAKCKATPSRLHLRVQCPLFVPQISQPDKVRAVSVPKVFARCVRSLAGFQAKRESSRLPQRCCRQSSLLPLAQSAG